MDPVTHIIAGGLQGEVFSPFLKTRRVMLFCILAAWIPDIDNLIGLINPELYLIHHRGITHSFLGGALLAVLFVAFYRILDRPISLFKAIIVAYAGILSHIFLDLITSYGTQILYPLSRQRYSMPCVFIIDPFLTLIAAAFWVLSYGRPKWKKTAILFGIGWLLVYPLFNLSIRFGLESFYKKQFRRKKITYARLQLTPELLTPVNWKLIVEMPRKYRMARVNLLCLDEPLVFSEFQKADRKLLGRLAEQAPFFRTYAWFAKYPVMRTWQQGNLKIVEFSDLRFRSALSIVQRLMKNKEPPFSLIARLDNVGDLISYTYQRPRGSVFTQHLE